MDPITWTAQSCLAFKNCCFCMGFLGFYRFVPEILVFPRFVLSVLGFPWVHGVFCWVSPGICGLPVIF